MTTGTKYLFCIMCFLLLHTHMVKFIVHTYLTIYVFEQSNLKLAFSSKSVFDVQNNSLSKLSFNKFSVFTSFKSQSLKLINLLGKIFIHKTSSKFAVFDQLCHVWAHPSKFNA